MTNEPSLYDAVQVLAENDPDFVQEKNEIGFNSYDCAFGHLLAETSFDLWTPRQRYQAWTMLRKYKRQLSNAGIDYEALPIPLPVSDKLVDFQDGIFRVVFSYNAELITDVKAIPGAFFSRQPIAAWYVRARQDAMERLVDFANRNQFARTPSAEDAIQTVLAAEMETAVSAAPALPPRRVDASGESFLLIFPYDARLVEEVRHFPSRKFQKEPPAWVLPRNQETAKLLSDFAAKHEFAVTPEAQAAFESVTREHADAVAASSAEDADLDIPGLGGTLRPFQKAAVKYALAKRRTYLAEEMGLGKTVEALAIIQAADAYPAIVVCPASLKINWQREAEKWLPGKKVAVLNGKINGDWQAASVVILNYEILSKWLESLRARGFKAVVFDEFHFCKNRKAIRSQSAKELAKEIPYVLGLTGTPILNRPSELIQPLTILGRLDDLGGFWHFVRRYCDGYQDRFGWNLDGAANLDELNEKLRTIGYVRHEKKDVLKELPPKTRTVVPLPIDNRQEYESAEADVVAFMGRFAAEDKAFRASIADLPREEQKTAIARRESNAELKARRAEQLVRFEALKRCAAKGKTAAVREWIGSFLESGEKLVVFGWHRDVVDGLAQEYNAPSITGDTLLTERQVSVDKFQNDLGCKLIVCNIQAGGLGLTLTAASNAAFVEFGWNPAQMSQAEDRIHRIGQAEAVNIWNLVGEDTIDEEILALIAQKAEVVDAATDGRIAEGSGMFAELAERIARRKD